MNELDISDVLRKQEELENQVKQLRLQNKKLTNIINSTDSFIMSLDTGYNVVFWNKAVYDFVLKQYGVEMTPGIDLFGIFPETKAAAYREIFEEAKNSGKVEIDIHHVQSGRHILFSLQPVGLDGKPDEITLIGCDITERVSIEQEIVRLNASLEDRIKERTNDLEKSLEMIQTFTMTLTHDLKLPMQHICVLIGNITRNIDFNTNIKKLESLCRNMIAMISDLIDYERITASEIKKEPIDLKKMVLSVYDKLKTDRTVLDFETGIPRVAGDKSLIKRVLVNLISNAVKFTAKQQNPKIIFGCHKDGNEFVFYVKDNGIGINMKYADKLFNVFERIHKADEYEGHGLGLASVRNIITKHGGRTWIDGRVHVGTTVYFTLPDEPEESFVC